MHAQTVPSAAEPAIRKPRSAFESFALREPAQAKWIAENRSTFDFADKMWRAIEQYGHLTTAQAAAVLRCIDRDSKPAAERGQAVTIEKIEHAFASARDNGIKRPKLRLDTFLFKPAPATGSNPGAIYVTNEQGTYLGKVAGGRFLKSRECGAEEEGRVVEVASDPLNAAIAYGLRTGECAVCTRPLSAKESMDIGIGPICRERMGW